MVRLRLPSFTTAEKSALLALLGILISGAGLQAWEKSGITLGPVHDWESLQTLVVQSRIKDSTTYPCVETKREYEKHWPERHVDFIGDTLIVSESKREYKPKKFAFTLNLNTARQEDLQQLPGIGPATAKSIVTYRQAQGLFQKIEDLLLVKGIGDKKLETIRPYLKL